MWATRRCFRQPQKIGFIDAARDRPSFLDAKCKTDEYGIPTKPTWSVHELLSSYPKPTLSSSTLSRLHKLSALNPPAEATPEHVTLKEEMEEIIRLVEAVKLVDTQSVQPANYHGRDGNNPDQGLPSIEREASGQDLLQHALRTSNGYYVVDSDRKRA